MSDRFRELVDGAGLATGPRVEPDPGTFELSGRLEPPPTDRLVRRTAIPGLTTVGRTEARTWVLGVTALCAALGAWLALRGGYVMGDTLSRVASARFSVAGRDPHLAAVGFVFPPLVTVLLLPLAALGDAWRPLLEDGLAATAISALATGLAALEVVRIVREQTGRPGRAAAAGLAFALNPLVWFYGANGMSEALFTWLLLAACRRLMRWVRDDDVGGLVGAGVLLGVAYLVRYEAVVAAAAAMAVVAALDLARDRGATPWRDRAAQVGIDATTLLLPVALAFLGWALASWSITGEPFAQLTSQYGNTSIIALESGGGDDASVLRSLWWTLLLAPLLPLCAMWAARSLRRRADLPLVAVAVPFGAVLLFEVWSTGTGSTFPFLRYLLLVVPLGVIAAAVLPHRTGTVLCTLALLAMPVTAWAAMSEPSIGRQEHYVRAALFPSTASLEEQRMLRRYATERRLARALDRQRLPRGAVLLDALFGHPVVLASARPEQFVVSTDRDFAQALDRPWESGVRWFVAVPDRGRGESDALNRRWPGVYEDGAGIAEVVLEAPADGPDPPLRLLRVLAPEERVNGDRARPPAGR